MNGWAIAGVVCLVLLIAIPALVWWFIAKAMDEWGDLF